MSIGKITSVFVIGPTMLNLRWDDGRHGQIDLSAIIASHSALGSLKSADAFAGVAISSDGWSLEWPGGLDFGSAQLRRWADEQAGETMPAAAFRHWMEGHAMTLDTAATALGLSRRTIAYYLSGEQPVPKTVMLATVGYERMRAA
jgi:Protein of unknown function (DUF2442)